MENTPKKSLDEAVTNLGRFRPLLQAVIDVADAAGEVNNLMSLASEADARLRDKRDEEAKIDIRLDAAQKVTEAANLKLADAEAQALTTHEEAQKSARKVIDAAKAEAATLVARGRDESVKLAAEAKNELARLGREIDAKRIEVANLADDAELKQKELNTLNGDISAAHEHIAKLLKR
jgi:chromosome segregation ATPase